MNACSKDSFVDELKNSTGMKDNFWFMFSLYKKSVSYPTIPTTLKLNPWIPHLFVYMQSTEQKKIIYSLRF